jgi:homoserine kinase
MLGLMRGDWELLGRGLQDRLHQPRRAHLYPRSMELVAAAQELGAFGASISGAGPTVLVWSHYERTGVVVDALRRRTEGWADVLRAPFEPMGADVREL